MSSNGTAGAVVRTKVDGVTGFLVGAQVPFELLEHDSVMSASAEAHAAHLPPEQVAKTIVLHDGSAYVVAAISAADRLDMHKLRELLGAGRHMRLATEQELARDFPSLEVGSAPPFGPMVPAAEVIDRALAAQSRILCAAGDHHHSVLVDPDDVVRITAAKVADICEE